MADHDTLYHALFSHPVLVRQLLDAFVAPELVAGLDLERMERVNATFHEALKGRKRTADVIWRVPAADGQGLFLCLMLEFQSTEDWMMAVRAQVYQGLLWQQLADAKMVPRGGPLPPVLTLVIHNGDEPWRASERVDSLIGLPADSPLWPWQPQARYHLLAINSVGREGLAQPDNLAALLFRLERGHEDPHSLAAVVDDVLAWFHSHPGHARLMELFALLVRDAIRGFDPSAAVPGDMKEMRSMLSTQGQRWRERMKAEGRAEGRAEGKAEGQAETLLRLLRRRFGTLPAETEPRVRGACIEELDVWTDRLLDARTLDEVFEDARPN